MIREKTVEELIDSFKANKGRFCFFIGAGTSRAADIPLASELIEQWQRQKYEFEMRQSKRRKAFDKWIAKQGEFEGRIP